MALDLNEIPEKILNEEKQRQEEIVTNFQDLRNRIISVENEGVDVGALKMKMLEGKPLIEDGKLLEAALVKDMCEDMLINRIKYRNILDKLESAKRSVGKVRSMGLDAKRYFEMIRQASDLLDTDEADMALEIRNAAVDEAEGLVSLETKALDHLLKMQKIITKATEAGLETGKYDRKFIQIISHVDGGEFSKVINLSSNNLFKIQNEIQGMKAKEKISDIKEKLFNAKEAGLVVRKEDDEMVKEMEKAFENNDYATFTILDRSITEAIDLNDQYRNKVEETYRKTKRKLRQLKDNGIWDELVLDIFEQGEEAMKKGDYAFADECVHYLDPDVKKMGKLAEKQGISLNRIEAEETLRAAKKLVKRLEDLDVNTRNFNQTVRNSDELCSKGDYELVINLLQPIIKQMESAQIDALKRLRNDVFALLKMVNGKMSQLRDEGIPIDRFEDRMDDVQELIDNEKFRNAWLLLDGLDDDIKPVVDEIASFNELLPKCREKFESLENSPDFERSEKRYDALFSLKKKGSLTEAIEKAKDFLADADPSPADDTGIWSQQAAGPPLQQGVFFPDDEIEYEPDPSTSRNENASPGDQSDETQTFESQDREYQQNDPSYQNGYGSTYPQYDSGYENQYGTGYQSGVYSNQSGTAPGGQQYFCTSCRMLLQHIEEYDAWWCARCQRYEGE